MNRTTNASNGFSTIEMVAIVAISGLIASLALSATMQAHRREQINALTIGLAGWMEEVRRSALRGSPCEIVINTGTLSDNAVVATVEADTSPSTCSNLSNPYRLPEASKDRSYTISAEPSSFYFTPKGTKSPSGTIEIMAAMNNSNIARCIQLNGLLGNLEMGNASDGSCQTSRLF